MCCVVSRTLSTFESIFENLIRNTPDMWCMAHNLYPQSPSKKKYFTWCVWIKLCCNVMSTEDEWCVNIIIIYSFSLTIQYYYQPWRSVDEPYEHSYWRGHSFSVCVTRDPLMSLIDFCISHLVHFLSIYLTLISLGEVHPYQLWCHRIHCWSQYWNLYPVLKWFTTVGI